DMAVSPVSTTTAPPVSQSQTAQKALSTNFDTFLTLLTTQLKNQDPLSPMDSNQFTQQLVEFSQVEQQINSNQNLESLISLTKAQSATSAVSYLGKSLTLTDGTAPLMNGNATWAYSLDDTAASTRITVSDAKGKVVYVTQGETDAGLHAFNWNGEDNQGNALPAGVYTLKVTAAASHGPSIRTNRASQGPANEVGPTGNEAPLMIGPVGVPLRKATLVSN